MIYILNEGEMQNFINDISKDYEIFGAKEVDGEVVFTKIENVREVSEKKSKYAPKEFLIERGENVLSPVNIQKRAVFGVKSCDLKGFYIMDRQILNKDPFYTSRRKNTVFINYVCNEPCEGGFCTTFGGPVLEQYDIQVLKEDKLYYVMSSEKFDHYFKDYKRGDDLPFRKISEKFNTEMKPLPVDGIENRMKWDSKLWEKFASLCISCGACNFSCPTCYCFDLYDEGDGRKREWDSCILYGFTKTSAGNVRPNLSDRLRQRFYHKFSYYKRSQGIYLCSGCNRCVDDCPVGIDIKEVIIHDYSRE
ncbi:MAG: 4Fe-4S dicluster domain-containing protein [Thermoplasmatales archaeon]